LVSLPWSDVTNDVPPPPVYVRKENLPPTPDTAADSRIQSRLPAESPVPGPFDMPVPNEQIGAAPGETNPMRDPIRLERSRRPPDRYTIAALCAAYAECAAVGFDLHSPRLSDAAFHVDVTHGADRLVGLAHDLADQRGEVLLVAGEIELRREYDEAPSELQRAIVIAADAAQVANDLTSPQAKLHACLGRAH
jgi:hypothetical protein